MPVWELAKLIGKTVIYCSSSPPISPSLPQPSETAIQKLIQHNSFEREVQPRVESLCWKENLSLYDRSLISLPPHVIISSNASLEGWGTSCWGQTSGDPWSEEDRTAHINILELKAGIMTFTVKKKNGAFVHIWMQNINALAHLIKIGGDRYQELVSVNKGVHGI